MDSMISITFEILSAIGVILTLILIGLIITKTPKAMKNFKLYLLFYSIHLLCLEFFTGIYCPATLHPYVFFYPLGIAKILPHKLLLVIFGMAFYHAMSMYDCYIAMILERYYAMKNISTKPSKIPFYVFLLLSGLSGCYLIFMLVVVFYPPFYELLFIPVEENLNITQSLFGDISNKVVIDSIIIYQHFKPNTLPLFNIILLFCEGCRLPLMLGMLFLNATVSKNLKTQISPSLEKYNQMFFRMIIFQFLGILIFAGFPYLVIILVTLFVTEPSSMISYSFMVIDFFGVYDVLVVLFCIKPYRKVFLSWFQFCCGARGGRKIHVISPSSSNPPSIKTTGN